MKKNLLMICAVFFAMSVLAGCVGREVLAGRNSLPEQREASADSMANASEPGEMPDDSFRKEDYEKLAALQAEDYRHMTISDYRNYIAELTDTAGYRDLLERFWKSQILYEMRDTDKTAAFLFYVLPLAGEEWKVRSYSGETVSSYPADEARLEYTFTMTIQKPDVVMVKDYDDMRLGMTETMQDVLRNRTPEELRDEAAMQADIQAYVDEMIPCLQTPEVSIAIEFQYFSLAEEGRQPSGGREGREQENREPENGGQESQDQESRRCPNGTQEDYRSLLALKTADYAEMSIADFNAKLLAWAEEDFDRMERIDDDLRCDDRQVDLSEEERMFVELTAYLSGAENGKFVQSSYTNEEEDPVYGQSLPQKLEWNGKEPVWCDLYYQFSYHIADKETVTVGERDRLIGGMVHAVEKFWDEATLNGLLAMTQEEVIAKLTSLAAEYSSDGITVTLKAEHVHFEHTESEM